MDLGLTPDEYILLPDWIINKLYDVDNNRVDYSVYRRLKEDGMIEGRAFDVR